MKCVSIVKGVVASAAILFSSDAMAQCPNVAGTWQNISVDGHAAGDLRPMTITQTGCSVTSSFTSVDTIVVHDFAATLNGSMAMIRTAAGGCITQMFGSLFISEEGLVML